MENKGLSEQERLMLLTGQLNFLSCNLTAYWNNYLWLKNDNYAKDLNDIISTANKELETIVDNFILKLDEVCVLDPLQKEILKPIHKALAINSEDEQP